MNLFKNAAILTLLTFIPGLELRASIPYGFFTEIASSIGVAGVIGICLLANIMVGIATFWLMGPVVQFFRKWEWFERKIWPHFEKTRAKLHPYVEKYGEWGLAVFIGVPLPGTGAYSGAFGAYLLGFDKRRFLIANFFGVLIAAVCVTAVCVLLQQGVIADDSLLRRILIKRM